MITILICHCGTWLVALHMQCRRGSHEHVWSTPLPMAMPFLLQHLFDEHARPGSWSGSCNLCLKLPLSLAEVPPLTRSGWSDHTRKSLELLCIWLSGMIPEVVASMAWSAETWIPCNNNGSISASFHSWVMDFHGDLVQTYSTMLRSSFLFFFQPLEAAKRRGWKLKSSANILPAHPPACTVFL